jgi:glycine dehydrogenase subunit 2
MLDFMPSPVVAKKNGKYTFTTPAKSIGRIGAFYGNFGVLIKAYAYIRSLGAKGLREVSEGAVINANYLKEKLKAYYYLPYDRICMHEAVFSHKRQADKGVHATDIAKRLLDYGLHPPTIYFPLIVDGALMTEPTETESKATIDAYVEAMIDIAKDVDENPEILHTAPHNTPIRRLDDVRAVRQPDLRWEWEKKEED